MLANKQSSSAEYRANSRFTYAKDGSVYSNEDCAWIDNVTLPHQSRPVHFQSDTLCAGSLYIVAGDTINTSQSGSYTIVDNTASDSVLLVDYTVYPTYSIVDSLVACDSINWNGHTYYSSTSLDQYTASSSHGCDSVISLHLTVHPSYTTITSWFITRFATPSATPHPPTHTHGTTPPTTSRAPTSNTSPPSKAATVP